MSVHFLRKNELTTILLLSHLSTKPDQAKCASSRLHEDLHPRQERGGHLLRRHCASRLAGHDVTLSGSRRAPGQAPRDGGVIATSPPTKPTPDSASPSRRPSTPCAWDLVLVTVLAPQLDASPPPRRAQVVPGPPPSKSSCLPPLPARRVPQRRGPSRCVLASPSSTRGSSSPTAALKHVFISTGSHLVTDDEMVLRRACRCWHPHQSGRRPSCRAGSARTGLDHWRDWPNERRAYASGGVSWAEASLAARAVHPRRQRRARGTNHITPAPVAAVHAMPNA